MSLTPSAPRLHQPPPPSSPKPKTCDSHPSQTHGLAPSLLDISTLPRVASPSPSQQPTVSPHSAPGNTFASTAPSSIEGWLENVLQEASTSTSGYTTPPFESSATHSLKRKRSLSLNCHSGKRELRRVPLKKRYLERHLVALGSPNMSGVNQGGEDVSTGSKGKSSDKSALWPKKRMEKHRIYQDHTNFEKYPGFQAVVQRPFEPRRQYKVRPKSVEKCKLRFAYYKDGNEDSFKHALLKSVIKEEFDVLVEPGENGEDPIYRSSIPAQEGIRSKYSVRLRAGHLPHRYNKPGYEKKTILKRLQREGLYTPEPDGIWGFDPAKLPKFEFEPDTRELMNLCPKIHWPFFVLQCKLNASYNQTLNQVRRDGAAIVNVALKLLRKAGYPVDEPGPNFDTYIYSMTMSSWMAHWWVHWSEIDANGDRNFHMNRVIPGLLLEEDDLLVKLRNPMHTIIEWGLQKRMAEVKSRYATLAEADERAEDQVMHGKRGADSSALAAGMSGDTKSTGHKRSHSRIDSNSEHVADAATSSADS